VRSLPTYAASLAALAAAVLLRLALDRWLGDSVPFALAFAAVAAAVWLGGRRPALLVAVLGYFTCDVLFVQPRGTLTFHTVPHLVGVLTYLFTAAVIVAFGEAMRAAQARAREQRELFRITLASIGDGVITTDVDGRVTYLNAVAEALTGWSDDDARGQPLARVFRIVNDATRQAVESPATRALRDGAVVGLANHTILIKRNGDELAIDDSAAPIRDDEGRVSGCVLIFRDVTAQRRLEDERARQLVTARTLAAIVESSDDAIISKRLDGTIESWNTGAERIFGHSAAEAIGRNIALVIPPERLAEEDHILATLRAGKRIEHFETERVRRDGERILVSLTISPIHDDAGNVIGASKIVRDVTDRKRAEADRERFATLVESSTDFIGICDLQALPLYVNRAGLALVGLDDVEQARRTPVAEFFFPEDRARVMDEFFPTVLERGHGEIEVRFRHFKTHEPLWMAYKVLALRDAAGRPTAFATVSQDVSERKRMEDDLRTLAAHLSEADRRKDEFLATLAHELRNPLAPIRNMLEVMKRADGDRAVVDRARDTMERQLRQIVRLVDDLLDLNRISHNRLELRPTAFDVVTVLQQAVEASRPLLDAARHDLRVTLPSEPLPLHADAARLTQVFGNLINNSCKYTPPGGTIRVGARRDGDDVVVTVEDDGLGIPADKLDRIFDMFVQVEASAERSQGGLGIGLTLVKRLVEMHGGKITVRSDGAGRGSAFTVRLPMRVEPLAIAAPEPPAPAPARARRIVVVDDNSDSAISLAMHVEINGNETHTAHDGLEAIATVEKHRPEVVLLDIGLPKLSGHDVCRRIREEAWGKDIAIIALIGWGQDDDRRKSREAGFDGHLVKPVDYAALMGLLDTLDPPTQGGS
jgi:PAS domain S-box-containing protein